MRRTASDKIKSDFPPRWSIYLMATEPNGALTGAAFDLANAGYAPMPDQDQKPDEETIGSDRASLREAAERRSGPRD
jgi:hypothetical protein